MLAFAQFLDVAAFSNGEVINYSNIARDCGVDAKTVKEYYQILVDTLLGYVIMPYHHKRKREDLVVTPKFYYFDTGVVNGLIHQKINDLKGSVAGKFFEHYILMELMAYRGILVVCTAIRPQKYELGNNIAIDILPWQSFLEALWAGKIV